MNFVFLNCDDTKMMLRKKYYDVINTGKLHVYFSFRVQVVVLVVCGFFMAPHFAMAQNLVAVDSLKEEMRKAPDSIKFELLRGLFREYVNFDLDEALHYSNDAMNLALSQGDSLMIVNACLMKGGALKSKGDVRDAIQLYLNAFAISKRNKFRQQIKYLLNNLAVSYEAIANYDLALDYHFQSLEMRKLEDNPLDLSIVYNNIGVVYQGLKDYENALKYYTLSNEIIEKNQITHGVILSLINIGIALNELSRYDEAINYANKALTHCKDCEPRLVVLIHNNLGNSYLRTNQIDKAELNFLKAIEVARKTEFPEDLILSLRSLAKVESKKRDFSAALRYVNDAQELAQQTDLKSLMLENYGVYAEIYSAQGQYQKASEYKDKYIKLNGEIYNGDLIKNISNVQTRHEEKENLKTIAAKDEVLSLQQEVISRQRQQFVFIIIITILVMILAFVSFWASNRQRKANKALAEANDTIERKNNELKDVNASLEGIVKQRTMELTKVNNELDHFIYKTSHDIRGPLASIKGICNVAILDVKDEMAQGYLKKLDETVDKLNSILTRLLIVNQINNKELKSETVDLKEVFEEILLLERKKGLPSRLAITYDIKGQVHLESDRELVRLMLENLIDNGIKFHNHSERVEPFVKTKITADAESVIIQVTDNGIGIDQVSKDHIFQMFVRASERSETGGIGLYLTRLATERLHGTIDVITTRDRYTEFTVVLPKDLGSVLESERIAALQRKIELEASKQKPVRVS